MLHVAVRLPATIDDVGEYLADVTALEAAGASAIWIDDTGLDPWVLLGAMAAVTHRLRLGCMLTTPTRPAPKHFATSRQRSPLASRCRASASCR